MIQQGTVVPKAYQEGSLHIWLEEGLDYRDYKTHKINLWEKLDNDRLEVINFRLNDRGLNILTRMQSNNLRVLRTRAGKHIYRGVSVNNMIEKMRSTWMIIMKAIDNSDVKNGSWEWPKYVYADYNDVEAISPRSVYCYTSVYHDKEGKPIPGWIDVLSKYGRNWKKKLRVEVINQLKGILTDRFEYWAGHEQRSLLELFSDDEWLSHIKNGTNSGYPDNVAQDKDYARKWVPYIMSILRKYKNGEKINWTKFAFEPGMRSERKFKARVISMASIAEKIIGAVINAVVDRYIKDLPFKLPRSYGSLDNLCETILKVGKGKAKAAKDFVNFDTSIPVMLFEVIRDFFLKLGTDFGLLVAFECDLIIHGYMIVDKKLGYQLRSLFSGIGITQFIGSLIHWLVDEFVELNPVFAVYQSDDTMAVVNDDEEVVAKKFDDINEFFGMESSPFGKKSYYSYDMSIILQTYIDWLNNTYYGHDKRKFTNAFLRERALNVDDQKFSVLFSASGKELNALAQCDSWLGTLASMGNQSRVLPYLLAFTYGKRSGFSWSQVQRVLPHLGVLSLGFENFERVTLKNDFLRDIILKVHRKHGWSNVTPYMVKEIMLRA
jgi:hypothetical protein